MSGRDNSSHNLTVAHRVDMGHPQDLVFIQVFIDVGSCLTCEVFPILRSHVSHIISETTFGSDIILGNQLNQKFKVMVKTPGYVIYFNIW